MSDSLPTIASVIAELQTIGAQQIGTDQILQGINAISYAANTTLATALGQLSDQIAAMDADVKLRLASIDASVFALQQRVNAMSDNLSAQISAEIAVVKADFDALKAGVDTLVANAAKAVADAQARDTTDAASLAALQALHQEASSILPAPVAAPSEPSPAPAPADPAPAPSGDTGASGPAPAPAPTGDTGATGSTASAPPADGGSTGATA